MHVSDETRKKLRSYPNVVGVGYGLKVINGKPTKIRSIIVFTNRKVPVSALSPDQVVPTEIDELPTDVRVLKVKALAEDPPARSVIFIASTGEEEGMLGSKYFIKTPLIELQKIVFTINSKNSKPANKDIKSAINRNLVSRNINSIL